MSSNINQIPTAATSILATDKMYLGRSPFGVTDDRYILGSSIIGQFSPLTTKGDLYTYSTLATRLAVGSSDGQILQVSSVAATGLAWSTATYPSIATGTGTILRADGTNWVATTATYPATTAINRIFYSTANNVVGELATTNRASLSTSATGVPTWLALTNGQIVIGSTAGAPAAASLSAGPGISISGGSNTITISGTGSGIGWTEVTGTTQAMTADNGYVANNAGVVTFTLPATAAFGTAINVLGKGAGGWAVAQNAGQSIRIGSATTTVGVGGSLASTNAFDSFELICTTANTIWTAIGGVQGNLTIV